MKFLYFFLLILLPIAATHAQTCTIQISYDDNGNRILRELVCGTMSQPEEPSEGPVFYKRPALLPDSSNVIAGSFNVYPNPAAGQVFVQLDAISLQQPCTITLLDQLGREHFRKEHAEASTVISLDNLPDGLYYIILWRGEQKNTVKIVKEANDNR